MRLFGIGKEKNFNLEESLREAFRLGETKDPATRVKGIELYGRIVKRYPNSHVAWFNLGVVQSRNGMWEDAGRSFSHAEESPEFRALAAFARCKLFVENGRQVKDADVPEEFRGEKRNVLGVLGPCYNAANELRNSGYSCSVESQGMNCSIISEVGSRKYTITISDLMGILIKNVYLEEQGKTVSLLDLDPAMSTEIDETFKRLDVGRLPLVQAYVAGALDGITYSKLQSAAKRKYGSHGWAREGRSFEEVAALKKAEAKRAGVNLVQTSSFEDIARANCPPGNFLVCVLEGEPRVIAVLAAIQNEHIPMIRRGVGACVFRGEFFSMPEYPLIHLGLGILTAFYEGQRVALSLVENLGNFVEANLQDWVTAIEKKKYTAVHIYGPDYSHIVTGRRDLEEAIIKEIVEVVNKANSAFEKIPETALDFKKACNRFFGQYPDPFLALSRAPK